MSHKYMIMVNDKIECCEDEPQIFFYHYNNIYDKCKKIDKRLIVRVFQDAVKEHYIIQFIVKKGEKNENNYDG